MALWFFEDPGLFALREAVESGHLQLVARCDSLDELRRVLAYRQFAIPPQRQQSLLEEYTDRIAHQLTALDLAPKLDLPACRDPDDQKFLDIAALGKAKQLITRDKLLLKLARHRVIKAQFHIITPEAWVKAAAGCAS